jgi:hypothetical protein
MQGRRHRFVVSTKYTVSRQPSDPNAAGNHGKPGALAEDRSAGSVISQAKSGGRLAMKARMPSAASPSTNSPSSNRAS